VTVIAPVRYGVLKSMTFILQISSMYYFPVNNVNKKIKIRLMKKQTQRELKY